MNVSHEKSNNIVQIKTFLSTNYVSSIEWIISLGNWIRVWKHQFRCQAICYLYLACDHLLTCLNVWHGENQSNRRRQDMDYTNQSYKHAL